MSKKIRILALFALMMGIFGICMASSANLASFVTPQISQPSFQTYYSSSDINTYWPILSSATQGDCQSSQNVILQVAPFGCQPAVVRSDLLADQNVPVMCQIDALNINPAINVKQIKNIRFTGNYPKEISGVGFHPARAALNTKETLTGSPLLNNVGYVVVVLNRNQNESSLPSMVNVTLSAQIDYDSTNAYGIGRAEFKLEQMSELDWLAGGRDKQSFWGSYYVKLEEANDNTAKISIYKGDERMGTVDVKKGEVSNQIYVPGSYCQTSLQVQYNGFEAAKNKVVLGISNDINGGTDRLELYEGSTFLDSCRVLGITINPDKLGGKVSAECNNQRFELKLTSRAASFPETFLADYGPDHTNVYNFNRSGNNSAYYIGHDVDAPLEVGDNFMVELNYNGEVIGIEQGISLSAEQRKWIKEGFAKAKTGKGASINTILQDSTLAAEQEKLFGESIAAFEKVAQDYSAEKDKLAVERYGETALREAINLAEFTGKQKTESRLLDEFFKIYPDAEATDIKKKLEDLAIYDRSNASTAQKVNNAIKIISLIDINEPANSANADFTVAGQNLNLKEKKSQNITIGNDKLTVILEKINNAKSVVVNAQCNYILNGVNRTDRQSRTLSLDGTTSLIVCNRAINLEHINVDQVVSVSVIPATRTTNVETNLTVAIGIEKRAIQLSPEKTREMIKSLNESIQKMESITKTLGNVVKGLQGACLATGALLTVKDFFTGLGGESLARQTVMRGAGGWNDKCRTLIASTPGLTMDKCIAQNSDEIDKDVELTAQAYSNMNKNFDELEKPYINDSGAFLGIFGKSLNQNAAKESLRQYLIAQYPNENIGDMKISEALRKDNVDSMSYNSLKSIYLDFEKKSLAKGVEGSLLIDSANKDLSLSAENIKKLVQARASSVDAAKSVQNGFAPEFYAVGNVKLATVYFAESIKTTDPATYQVLQKSSNEPSSYEETATQHTTFIGNDGRRYVLGLRPVEGSSSDYRIVKAIPMGVTTGEFVGQPLTDFLVNNKMGPTVSSKDSVTYHYTMSNPTIRFYENEPYKGFPALVPFDRANGWYAATKPTLPAFGGLGAFDSSGRVTSFWLCNVGKNYLIDFEQDGFGDDICRQVNLNTGESIGLFPGLLDTEAKRRVQEGMQAIRDAANGYGKSKITIGRDSFDVGNPAALVPETQCSDFMSPDDCAILFNVCDPVICPSSRCNLGGRYQVADVIQSGVIGSTLLCLNNFGDPTEGGVVIPVCLSGINAGLEDYTTILKGHRDCLAENLKTGAMNGFCDAYYSFYKCDLFWRQLSPFATTLVPNIIGWFYGQSNVKGGGEYATVTGAWDNAQKSINFMTQSYAGNLMKAFQARSISDVGTQVCKSYISANIPTNIQGLVEPNSPPQFNAWFSASKFSDATVPATSSYKVAYHIFAGKNSGVQYSVYLKNPPESSYYGTQQTIQVAYGFIGRGEYKDETKDFTSPEGYKQLCVRVNNQEECGFGQVSTSFALNELQNYYNSIQASDQNVKTASDCTSGSQGFESVLVNTNLQNAVEEGVSPALYKRGIIRICATDNPGSSTGASRFVDVGYCDNERVRCWLDSNSVKNAISDRGIVNDTLNNLQNNISAKLEREGYLSELDGDTEVKLLEENLTAMKKAKTTGDLLTAQSKLLLDKSNYLLTRVFMNSQKARIYLLEARIKANQIGTPIIIRKTLETTPMTPVEVAAAATTTTTSEIYPLSLNKDYTPSTELRIYTQMGKDLTPPIKVNGATLYLTRYNILGVDWGLGGGDSIIGRINNLVITMVPSFRAEIEKMNPDLFDYLDGAKISNTAENKKTIIPKSTWKETEEPPVETIETTPAEQPAGIILNDEEFPTTFSATWQAKKFSAYLATYNLKFGLNGNGFYKSSNPDSTILSLDEIAIDGSYKSYWKKASWGADDQVAQTRLAFLNAKNKADGKAPDSFSLEYAGSIEKFTKAAVVDGKIYYHDVMSPKSSPAQISNEWYGQIALDGSLGEIYQKSSPAEPEAWVYNELKDKFLRAKRGNYPSLFTLNADLNKQTSSGIEESPGVEKYPYNYLFRTKDSAYYNDKEQTVNGVLTGRQWMEQIDINGNVIAAWSNDNSNVEKAAISEQYKAAKGTNVNNPPSLALPIPYISKDYTFMGKKGNSVYYSSKDSIVELDGSGNGVSFWTSFPVDSWKDNVKTTFVAQFNADALPKKS